MHTPKGRARGIAVETVILAVCLLGGASWFGLSEIKHSLQEYKLQEATKKAEEAAKIASDLSAKALADREEANAARKKADDALTTKVAKEAEVGRTIQRSSTEGATAAGQLPESVQRSHLLARFDEIDTATAGLVGEAAAADVARWKQLAADALAGRAEAQARIDEQKAEITRLVGELKEERERFASADADAKTANTKATAEQVKATAATKDAEQKTADANRAASATSAAEDLISGLKKILLVIAVVWLAAGGLKTLALAVPSGSPAANWLHTAANAASAALAPASVLAEVHARRETNELLVNTGEAVADLRDADQAVAEKAVSALDVAFPVSHQRRVRAACIAARRRKVVEKLDRLPPDAAPVPSRT